MTGLVPNAVYHARLVATNSAGTVTSSDEVFTTGTLRRPRPPTFGQTANVMPVSGWCSSSCPAREATARAGGWSRAGFIPLTQARQVPVGSQIDARRGTLEIGGRDHQETPHPAAPG